MFVLCVCVWCVCARADVGGVFSPSLLSSRYHVSKDLGGQGDVVTCLSHICVQYIYFIILLHSYIYIYIQYSSVLDTV